MESKREYRKPDVSISTIYFEDTLTSSSSSTISGGTNRENYQPEISDWLGSDLNTSDGYNKGDI